jgi:hypothetical protein
MSVGANCRLSTGRSTPLPCGITRLGNFLQRLLYGIERLFGISPGQEIAVLVISAVRIFLLATAAYLVSRRPQNEMELNERRGDIVKSGSRSYAATAAAILIGQ